MDTFDRPPTFAAVAQSWLALQSHLAPSTLTSYRKNIEHHWIANLGDRPIGGITYGEVATTIARIKWASTKTRNNAIIPLRGIFQYAVEEGWADRNPTLRVKNGKHMQPPPDPFTVAEMWSIIKELEQGHGALAATYFQFSFFTGLRTGEQLALRWADIDFERDLLVVQRARVEKSLRQPKTSASRLVELNEFALAALRVQRECGKDIRGHDFVFWKPTTFAPFLSEHYPGHHWWRPTLHTLGIRYRRPYNTRHTFATMNLMAGANPMWVARQLGHRNMKMLLDRYSRWLDGADRKTEKRKLESFAKMKAITTRSGAPT